MFNGSRLGTTYRSTWREQRTRSLIMVNITLATLHILHITLYSIPNFISKWFSHIKPLLINHFVVRSIHSKKRINRINMTLATQMIQTVTTTLKHLLDNLHDHWCFIQNFLPQNAHQKECCVKFGLAYPFCANSKQSETRFRCLSDHSFSFFMCFVL